MTSPMLFKLSPLEVEDGYIRDTLRCLFQTILFHRAMGPVKPAEGVLEVFDVYYAQCDDADIAKKVEAGIDIIVAAHTKSKKETLEAAISFFEKKTTSSWLGKSTQEVCWEQWLLTLCIKKSSPDLGEELRRRIEELETQVTENKNHLPPLTQEVLDTKQTVTFPFVIGTSPASGTDSGFWANLFNSTAPSNVI